MTANEHKETGNSETDIRPLSDAQLDNVDGGTGKVTQIRWWCQRCGWSTGWHPATEYINDLAFQHCAQTGHAQAGMVFESQ